MISAQQVENDTVLAKLGPSQTITLAEVDFYLGRTGRPNLEPLNPAALNSAIFLVAQQRQALQTLRRLGQAVDGEGVRRWLEDADPANRDASEIISSTANEAEISETTFLECIAFRLSWKGYVAKHVTETNLNKHFANQKERFDGTKYEIELISIPASAGGSPQREALAKSLREWESSSGDPESISQDTWNYRKSNIAGTGDVDPRVIDHLLTAEEAQWSEPIHTAAGVHLVRLQKKQAGELTFQQVQGEVRQHMLLFLLNHLASQSKELLPLLAAQSK